MNALRVERMSVLGPGMEERVLALEGKKGHLAKSTLGIVWFEPTSELFREISAPSPITS